MVSLPSHFAQSFPCPRRPCTPKPYKYIYINTRIYIYIYIHLQRMFFCYSCVTNVVHKCKYFSTLEECAEMSYCLSEPRVVESWFFGEKKWCICFLTKAIKYMHLKRTVPRCFLGPCALGFTPLRAFRVVEVKGAHQGHALTELVISNV